MERKVFLGTKPCDGYGRFATHWAVRVGDDSWTEVDGGSGVEESEEGDKNTINGGSPARLFRGANARSGSTVHCVLGTTDKTDGEIDEFNRNYLLNNPKYSIVQSNCQDYVISLVQFLVGDTSKLPYREVGKYATGVGIGIAGLALAGIAAFFSKKKSVDEQKEDKNKVEDEVNLRNKEEKKQPSCV
eukprot:GFUD01023396.1.p1 GENE.GFUD01023396.1~~GFUD01023396.1.p1  ORF type:complete len:187 (+),score=59.24 GFUD01023396.1:297-857(+)